MQSMSFVLAKVTKTELERLGTGPVTSLDDHENCCGKKPESKPDNRLKTGKSAIQQFRQSDHFFAFLDQKKTNDKEKMRSKKEEEAQT